jgi:hypothetical protein
MIASFLHKTFIQPNVRTMAQSELASRLADYLYGLREKLGEDAFPRRADQYLDDWAADSRGWLRKYYPPGSDEAHYDLTPPTERAIDWLAAFNQRQFVGAESRLMTVFALLREIAQGTDEDPASRIATFDGGKGTLLEEIFAQRDAIAGSDQGKSFRAFWDFLMSPARQEEFTELLQAVFALKDVEALSPDRRLMRIHYDWLEAGEVAQRTVARLSEQLRRYLDDQAWLENRRIMQLIRNLEQSALAVRDRPPADSFMELEEPAPSVDLAMERPLYSPPFKARFAPAPVVDGDQDLAADALFDQIYVDKSRLMAHIRKALQTRPQVSLADLVKSFPLEQGLAELVAYLSLATEDNAAVIDDRNKQELSWVDSEGRRRRATLPLVIFSGHAA